MLTECYKLEIQIVPIFNKKSFRQHVFRLSNIKGCLGRSLQASLLKHKQLVTREMEYLSANHYIELNLTQKITT